MTSENEQSEGDVGSPSPARPDPMAQSLFLLVTMVVMLGAARFVVPSVVEEIRYAWHRGELRAEYETGTEGLKNVSLDALSDAYQMVTAVVGPSVVHIEVVPLDTPRAPFGNFPADQSVDQGSGVIVDEHGHVLTNRHVIDGAKSITVALSDGRRVEATVVGTDPITDLAVLHIDADGLIPIVWGDSDRCRVGSPVWAVGSPFGLERTITFGILSGKHRVVRAGSQHGVREHGATVQYQDFMQSDVAVNPGNSGGPLVDAGGTLIGINTAIVGDSYRGVSFSIPSTIARHVFDNILKTGSVDRGWVGVVLSKVPEDEVNGDDMRKRGARVAAMPDADSPAALAGIQVGDIILSVGDHDVNDVGHLMRMIGSHSGGSTIQLKIHRDGELVELPVTLGSRPVDLGRRMGIGR